MLMPSKTIDQNHIDYSPLFQRFSCI